jgi:hypothetical protein
MKNINFILVPIFCCIVLICCENKPEELIETVVVDFNDYMEKPITEISDNFYSNRRYVVLHSDEPNMMLGNISTVVIRDSKIYVADSRSRNLIVHDMNGRAISKVGNRGRGPGEYITLENFDVDNQGQIHVIDGNTKRLLIYDTNYKFSEVNDFPFSVDIIKCMPDGGYLLGLSSWDKSKYGGNRILKTTRDLIVENTSGNFDKKVTDDNVMFSPYYFIETPNGIFYHKSVDENVYQLDEKGEIKKKYFFDLGRNAVPMKYRNNLEPLINSDEMTTYRALMNFAVPYGKYVFGSMYDRGVPKSFIYDLDNHIAYMIDGKDATNFGYFWGISNSNLITFFPYANSGNLPKDLPEEMRRQVADGDILICLYEFK